MNNRPLVIFTHFYPFGELELFLETEIPHLKELFSHIVIIPNVIDGPQREVPKGVFIETSFATTFCGKDLASQMRKMARAFMFPPFYTELWRAPKKMSHLRKLLGYASEAFRCESWLNDYLVSHPELQNALFYTYWFYDHTTGIARIKKRYPQISIVSRAHGFDLYEEDYEPAYIPFRSFSVDFLDRIFLISTHGYDYFCRRFPQSAAKASISKLGVEDPGFTVKTGNESSFKLVSCAHLVPLKRLHLQIDGIASFARKHPNVPVIWQHIGDGPLREKVQAYASKRLPPWVDWSLPGHMRNQDVFALYKAFRPDLFLLMSETEGLPVSLMEAYACGIPAVATAVGGVPEIVNAENGILLPRVPMPDDIAQALSHLWQSPDDLKLMREAARNTWEMHFNAQRNYRLFASLLEEVVHAET